MTSFKALTNGFIVENPIFVIVLGMCPALAVTTSLINALGMGIATAFVLVCANVLISVIKSIVPDKVRIPCYIVVIAAFVTIVDLSMQAYTPDLSKSLGIFIPLIVVNCLPLQRAEAFAGKQNIWLSFLDGIGMGVGFTIALALIGVIREILGTGLLGAGQLGPLTLPGIQVLPHAYSASPMLGAILAPGAFLTMGFLMAIINKLKAKYGIA